MTMNAENEYSNSLHTASQWEECFSNVKWQHDITEMHFCRGMVTRVSGYIYMQSGMKRVSWNKHGLCFSKRRRIQKYDIKFVP